MIPWLWACTPDDDVDGPPPVSETVETGAPEVAIRFVTEPLHVGWGHHATAAIRPDGVALVTYSDETTVTGARVEGEALEEVPLAQLGLNHPQVRAWDGGFLVVASVDSGLGVVGTSVAPDGRTVGPGVVLEGGTGLLPDLDDGVAMWSDLVAMRCVGFTGAFEALEDRPCPERVATDGAVGTVTVRGTVHAWTERFADGSFTVQVAVGTEPRELAAMAWGGDMAGRPTLAAGDDGFLVAWRGAEGEKEPVRSWLQAFDAGGNEVGAPFELGLGERPALGGPAGGQVALAWEEEAQLWLQLRDAATGEPVTEPVSVATEPNREPRRPSVDLVAAEDGGLQGIVSWEAAPHGSPVENDDRLVRVRRFEVR